MAPAAGTAPGSRPPGSRRASRGRRRRAALGLELADVVAHRGGLLEVLALDRPLQLVVQPLDLPRPRRAGAPRAAHRPLAAVVRVAVDAAQQRPELELERRVAVGAAEPPGLLELRV